MRLELKTMDAINLSTAIVAAQMRLKGVSPALALRLAFNHKKLQEIVVPFQDRERALLEECADRDEKGNFVEDEKRGGVRINDNKRWNDGRREMLAEVFPIELRELPIAIFPESVDADVIGGLYPIIVDPEVGVEVAAIERAPTADGA
jgi:hypothetical protein